MRKGFLMLVICAIIKLARPQDKGVVHYCKKGTDCVGLVPTSDGCMTRKNGEFQCFYVKKNRDLRHRTFEFHFDN
jgi:hypothetical protein